MSEGETATLTDAQKARIERNRIKALSLKQAKLVSHPYALAKKDTNAGDATTSIIKVQGSKYIDSGGGFLIEQPVQASQTLENKGTAGSTGNAVNVVHESIAMNLYNIRNVYSVVMRS
ncbi:hypothetical protein DOY81_010634 [Sarcophaga bullata]|nr:hypothetical protein DOY81_010634 [Sarcophaga bullata]